jgi:hypothetical protein
MWAPNRPSGPAVGPSAADPAFGGQGAYLQKASVAKEAETPLPTAIESTLVLQDKYARALEDLRREQERSRDITEQKQQLTDENTRLQADLTRTQQELGEANGLLVQMRTEIEKWKGDVIGFRDELRQSNRAQLDALAKVMTLLGGETSPKPETTPPTVKPATSAAASPVPAAVKPAAVAAATPVTTAGGVAMPAGRLPAGKPAPAKASPASGASGAAMAPVSSGGGKDATRANGG